MEILENPKHLTKEKKIKVNDFSPGTTLAQKPVIVHTWYRLSFPSASLTKSTLENIATQLCGGVATAEPTREGTTWGHPRVDSNCVIEKERKKKDNPCGPAGISIIWSYRNRIMGCSFGHNCLARPLSRQESPGQGGLFSLFDEETNWQLSTFLPSTVPNWYSRGVSPVSPSFPLYRLGCEKRGRRRQVVQWLKEDDVFWGPLRALESLEQLEKENLREQFSRAVGLSVV